MNLTIMIGLVSAAGVVTCWHIVRTIHSGKKNREWAIRQSIKAAEQASPAVTFREYPA
jgi:hypothetical protein